MFWIRIPDLLAQWAPNIEKKILATGLENVFITAITECELYYGAFKSSRVERNVEILKELRRKVKTLHTSAEVARLYGRIKTKLERAGRVLDDSDLLIAAIVVVSKGILITNNTSHFQRIPDVEVENWK